MRRWGPIAAIATTCVMLPALALVESYRWIAEDRVTTCRLSPDETLRVWLVDLHIHYLDRNVSVRLERLGKQGWHEMITLLRSSPDEGRLAGTERFIWSRDGTKILLVGRHFFVRDDLMLANGDQMYFFHDLTTGRSWINSESGTSFPALTAAQIAGVEFTERVILQPRAMVDPRFSRKAGIIGLPRAIPPQPT